MLSLCGQGIGEKHHALEAFRLLVRFSLFFADFNDTMDDATSKIGLQHVSSEAPLEMCFQNGLLQGEAGIKSANSKAHPEKL